MRLSIAQQNELVVWKYFMPLKGKWEKENDADLKKFFEWSERGLHKGEVSYGNFSYFEALRQGKRWAGINMHEMYEQGILDLSMPYFIILGGNDITIKRKWWQFWKPEYTFKHDPPPRQVVNYMKKEMFKGMDAEIIEECYQNILEELIEMI